MRCPIIFISKVKRYPLDINFFMEAEKNDKEIVVTPLNIIVSSEKPQEITFTDENPDCIIGFIKLLEKDPNDKKVEMSIEYIDITDDKEIKCNEIFATFENGATEKELELVLVKSMKPIISVSGKSKVQLAGSYGPDGFFDDEYEEEEEIDEEEEKPETN